MDNQVKQHKITFRVSEEELMVIKKLSNGKVSEYVREKVLYDILESLNHQKLEEKINNIEYLIKKIIKKSYITKEMVEEIFCENEKRVVLLESITEEADQVVTSL